MVIQGSFGYKIGRKTRLMNVQHDADLLWQICVREIYVLMKHYGSIEQLRKAFEDLKEAKAKTKPKSQIIEKCRPYTDLNILNDDWTNITKFCQHSFINILESGYFLNNGEKTGLNLLLDFNTNSVTFYQTNKDKTEKVLETATIDEILEFDDMPSKTLTEIVTEFKQRFNKYEEKIKEVNSEINKIQSIIEKTKELGGEQNIIQKAKTLLDNMEWEIKKIEMDYRYFYHRLDDLNLLDHSK
jgi:vacuolar-type H+-ATPase subunit I/STV1